MQTTAVTKCFVGTGTGRIGVITTTAYRDGWRTRGRIIYICFRSSVLADLEKVRLTSEMFRNLLNLLTIIIRFETYATQN